MRDLLDLPERLRQRIRPDESGCWLWIGQASRSGHGVITTRRGHELAHRAVWEALFGHHELPAVLHHECKNKLCVNPAHLTPTTAEAHDDSAPGVQRSKTHCPKGHAYTPANTYRTPQGARMCRRCAREERLRQALVPSLRRRRRVA